MRIGYNVVYKRIRTRLQKFGLRLRLRAQRERRDPLARQDPGAFRIICTANNSPGQMTKKDIIEAWKALCSRARRSIPVPESGLLPILYEKDSRIRDAGIKWYLGSFPGNPDTLRQALSAQEYQRHTHTLRVGMLSEKWAANTRRRTIDSLAAVADILENRGS